MRILKPLNLLIAFVGAFAAASAPMLRRYVVEGRSMLQAYEPGQRLLVERLSYRLRAPRLGEVVVVRQPGTGGRLDLKRLVAGPGAHVTLHGEDHLLAEDEWYVLGDNLSESVDSRRLGPTKRADIVGRVWLRY